MITNGYITLEALKSALGDSFASQDADYERAIEAASRRIDRYCNRGHFWREPAAVARVLRTHDAWTVRPGDFATAATVTVRTDDDDDGTYETLWASSDWQAEPLARPNGEPFTTLTAVGSRTFPVGGRRARVQVTAEWGWPFIPKDVEQACQVLAIDYYKHKDQVGGVAGFGDFGAIRLSGLSSTVRDKLDPLRLMTVA